MKKQDGDEIKNNGNKKKKTKMQEDGKQAMETKRDKQHK